MKIINIKEISYHKYELTVVPNWFERLFGYKATTKVFKATGNSYLFGGQNIYIDEKGNETENWSHYAEEIDKWRRKESL